MGVGDTLETKTEARTIQEASDLTIIDLYKKLDLSWNCVHNFMGSTLIPP